ncbi:MAG: DUF255 domain-containing protein [Ignavibacteriae bacterium]|nr:MAG: DUF255 domain-containing protein [Ignavibacteriota bacterium]
MKISLKPVQLLFALMIVFFVSGNIYAQTGNFEDALKLAKEKNKKVIVDIYTDWCGWCVKMDKDAYGNNEIKQIIDDNFVMVKLDAESLNKIHYQGKSYTGEELAVKFEASGYPTTVFLSPDGDIIEYNYDKYKMKNLPGYFGAKEFKIVLEYIRDDKYKDTDLSSIL